MQALRAQADWVALIACGYSYDRRGFPSAASPQVHLLGRAAGSSLTERVQRVHCSGWGIVGEKVVAKWSLQEPSPGP